MINYLIEMLGLSNLVHIIKSLIWFESRDEILLVTSLKDMCGTFGFLPQIREQSRKCPFRIGLIIEKILEKPLKKFIF